MRDMSKYKSIRKQAASMYGQESISLNSTVEESIEALEAALYFSTIISYAQGMHLLAQASTEYKYDLKMEGIALIWRGGCIIRSVFLEDMYQAFKRNTTLPHLLLDNDIQKTVSSLLEKTRHIIATAITSGIAMPGHTAAISYFDSFKSEKMPSNLIQAQRDYFGAHTYELIGKEGVHHTQWFAK
jgi:6-phosphogluconate dehydrogenase